MAEDEDLGKVVNSRLLPHLSYMLLVAGIIAEGRVGAGIHDGHDRRRLYRPVGESDYPQSAKGKVPLGRL